MLVSCLIACQQTLRSRSCKSRYRERSPRSPFTLSSCFPLTLAYSRLLAPHFLPVPFHFLGTSSYVVNHRLLTVIVLLLTLNCPSEYRRILENTNMADNNGYKQTVKQIPVIWFTIPGDPSPQPLDTSRVEQIIKKCFSGRTLAHQLPPSANAFHKQRDTTTLPFVEGIHSDFSS